MARRSLTLLVLLAVPLAAITACGDGSAGADASSDATTDATTITFVDGTATTTAPDATVGDATSEPDTGTLDDATLADTADDATLADTVDDATLADTADATAVDDVTVITTDAVSDDVVSTRPYPALVGSGWQLLWHDELDGRPCDPDAGDCGADAARVAACYDGQANLQHKFHAAPGDTVRADEPALRDLDKCVWSIDHHVNWIHFTNDQQDLIQLYDPRMIAVDHGELRLQTRFDHGTGPCGSNGEDPTGQSCPYLGAALTTIPFNGAAHAFPKGAGPYAPGDGLVMPPSGRLEIRAKLPSENGNMAALWTWTVGSPFEHEHDILEYFLNWRTAHHQGEVQYHDGQTSEHGAWVVSDDAANTDRARQFHVYALEWTRGGSLRYLFDEVPVAEVDAGDGVLSTGDICWAEEVNGNPFYLILWNLMTTYWYAPEAAPIGPGQQPDWLHVDYVRLYEACATDAGPGCVDAPNAGTCERPCDGYGAWDGSRCVVGDPPGGAPALVIDGQYGYAAASGCPFGGVRAGDGCVLGGPPSGRVARVVEGRYAVDPVCTPGEGIYSCARPCPWPGTTVDGDGCYVGRPPADHAGFVYDHAFYYEPSAAEPRCPDGAMFDSVHCYVGPAPDGSVPVIIGDAFYLEPDHCAYGGTWDSGRGACRFFTAPAGRTAFVYEGRAYYTPVAGPTPCEPGAAFDGANCLVSPVPPGADPFVDGRDIWLQPTCGTVTAGAGAHAQPDYRSCPAP